MAENGGPLVGQNLGGYRIVRLIGQGSMGSVYQATQLSVERTVALKVLAPERITDRKFVIGFLREARSAAKLSHPNVVQIHNVAQERGFLIFSMEYLPGGSLTQLLKKEGGLPWPRALRMLREATAALLYAEERQIVHGEINPDNLLLTADQRLKVGELGLTTDLKGSNEPWQKRSISSLRYLAPEHLRNGPLDHRTDIYSLGSTFFHAFAGRFPFDGKSTKEFVGAISQLSPPPLSEVAPEVPGWISALIKKMMARSPDARFQSFREVLRVLEEHRDEEESLEGPHDASPPSGRKLAALRKLLGSRKGKAVAAVGLLFVLALLLLAAPRWLRPREPKGTSGLNEKGQGPNSSLVTHHGASAGTAIRGGPDRSSPAQDPETPDPSTKDTSSVGAEEAAGLRELEEIRANWSTKLLTREQATAQAAGAAEKYKSLKVTEAAERLRGEIGQEKLKEEGKEIEKRIDAELKPELSSGQYKSALARIQSLRSRFPASSSALDEKARAAQAAAQAEVEKIEAEVEKLLAAGQLTQALDLLEELKPRIPEGLEARIDKKAADVKVVQSTLGELEKEIEGVVKLLHERLAKLDFSGAEEAIAKLPQRSLPAYVSKRARLAEEAALVREAWERLFRGLSDVKARSAPLDLALRLPGGKAGAAFSAQIKAIGLGEGGERTLSLQKRDGKIEDVDLFSLDDPHLLGFLQEDEKKPPEARQVEGLGLLLLHARGASRAERCLVKDSRLGDEKNRDYERRLLEVGRADLRAELASIGLTFTELIGRGKAATDKDWTSLVAAASRAILEHGGHPYYPEFKAEASSFLVRSVKEKARLEGPRSFFHAHRVKTGAENMIELSYDFSSEDELDDFFLISSSGDRSIERKQLKLRGEWRLLRGDPFKTRLDITLDVSQFSSAAPNINLALWTHEGDRVTYDSSYAVASKVSPDGSAPDPVDDFLVLSVGYQPRASSSVRLFGSPNLIVPTPCFVILEGVHGKPLHANYDWRCLWGEPIGTKVKGMQHIRVVMRPDAFQWLVNNENLSQKAYRKSPSAIQSLQKNDARGSITFFTNGETVHFDSIRIEGELNPQWLEEELERRARAELKALDPSA